MLVLSVLKRGRGKGGSVGEQGKSGGGIGLGAYVPSRVFDVDRRTIAVLIWRKNQVGQGSRRTGYGGTGEAGL